MTGRKKYLILIIEDDAATRYAIGTVLRKAAFEVIEASTGTEGLLRLSQNPDLIFLDVGLPDISGLEVCRRIRRSSCKDLPIIQYSSSFRSQDDFLTGHLLGADAYLVTPIEPALLIECASELIHRTV